MPPKTRKEAIAMCHGISHPESLVQALEAFGLLNFQPERDKIDWSKPLLLETYEGSRRVLLIGMNMKNKKIVEVQGDDEYREVDEDGYLVGYDSWLINA